MRGVIVSLCVLGLAIALAHSYSLEKKRKGALHLSLSNSTTKKYKLGVSEDKKEKCLKDLGCFRIDGDFYDPVNRPINFLPYDREFINVKYRIYTTKNTTKYLLLSALDVKKFNFSKTDIDPKYHTKIITHGFIDNQLFGEWMKQMKDQYFKKGNHNVIIVDWSGGNAPPYTQAVSNTRVVGAEIALLVNTMKRTIGIKPRMVHLLGHSLGGQIVGYAGERIRNLGKITSFDPAQPFYQGMPPSVRIDPTDAQYVEIIHTDSKPMLLLGLGMSQLAGDVDFFPNGEGQPGCSIDRFFKVITDGIVEGLRRLLACDHQRSVDYFMESINSKCKMIGYPCNDWKSFVEGKCTDCGENGEKCAIMGSRPYSLQNEANKTNSLKLFMITHHSAPYCLYHYHVVMKLNVNATKKHRGSLFLTLNGSKNQDTLKMGKASQDLQPGAVYDFLVTSPKVIGNIESIDFKWRSSDIFNIFTTDKLLVDSITVIPMFELNKKKQEDATLEFCLKPFGDIETGKTVIANLTMCE